MFVWIAIALLVVWNAALSLLLWRNRRSVTGAAAALGEVPGTDVARAPAIPDPEPAAPQQPWRLVPRGEPTPAPQPPEVMAAAVTPDARAVPPMPAMDPPASAPAAVADAVPDATPLERLLDALNALATAFDFDAADRFSAEWEWRGVRAAADGRVSFSDGGPLWYVEPTPGDGVIIPSLKVVQSWNKFYRSLNGAQAQIELGGAFDLLPGESLMLRRAATARLVAEQVTIVTRGELAGI